MGSHLLLQDASGQGVSEVHYYNDGDWATRVLTTNGFAAYGHYGWEWLAPHDGLGNSLELINPALPNSYAQNWGSSSAIDGTPGRANSIVSANAAPFITEVQHQPVIPRSTDTVTISARIVDEPADGLTATLHWRLDGASSFNTATMYDDGARWVIHFADGTVREWPVIYGEQVRDWWWSAKAPKEASQAAIVWEGHQPTKSGAESVRLFKATWTNPAPDVEVRDLDFVLGKANVRPFVIAITAE